MNKLAGAALALAAMHTEVQAQPIKVDFVNTCKRNGFSVVFALQSGKQIDYRWENIRCDAGNSYCIGFWVDLPEPLDSGEKLYGSANVIFSRDLYPEVKQRTNFGYTVQYGEVSFIVDLKAGTVDYIQPGGPRGQAKCDVVEN